MALPIAAGVLLVATSTGRVLLCKRRKDGFWGVPGGRLERGETAEQAARRELVEETGYRGALQGFQLVRSSKVFALFGAVVPREFSPVLNEEHSRCGWYDPRHHPRPLHPGLDGVVELG